MLVQVLDLLYRYGVLAVFRLICQVFRGQGEFVQPTSPEDTLLRCSAVDLAAKIRNQEVSSVIVVKTFIARIKQINPLLNCVVDDRYEDALKDAKAADELIASKQYTVEDLESQWPFLGIPFSTKDHNAVKGLLYTAGVVARKGMRSEVDSDSVALMRKAGAIPFVLTNVPEMCLSYETYNCLHGQTKNAYDTNRIPGGSSGGEGSLLTSGGCPLGLGTDIGGSIRIPSFCSGIFGHKPSACIVSVNGTLPDAPPPLDLLATIGPMSRYAEDLRPALKILAGEKAAQLRLDEKVDIKKLKVFYQLHDGGSPFTQMVDKDIQTGIKNAANYLEKVCEKKPQKAEIHGLRNTLNLWLNGISTMDLSKMLPSPWLELLKWSIGLSNHTLQFILVALQGKIKMPDSQKTSWDAETKNLINEFTTKLGNDGVFLYPTHPTVAPYHSEPIARFPNVSYTGAFNVLGLPSTAVPLGIGSEGLPIGLQVVASHGQDRLCLAVACELEKAFGGWVEPGKNFA